MRLSKALLLNSILTLALATAYAEDTESQRLHLDWRDTSISPAIDFYSYANGNWKKNNPIPADYSRWSPFSQLQETVSKRLLDLVTESMKDAQAKPGSIEQKVGDFYASGMDEKTINDQGIKPLQLEFDRINAIQSSKDLQAAITHLQLIGVNAVFNFSSMNDFKNSQQMIAVAYQGGLGLPNKDYYLKKDKKFQEIRNAYSQHMTKMFELLGESPKEAQLLSKKVLRLETKLAQISLSPIEERDPYAIYHMMNLNKLQSLTPDFSWADYFQQINHTSIKSVNMAIPGFFNGMNRLLKTVPIEDWKAYLRWHLIDAYASYLSQPFEEEDFKMNSVLSGTEKQLPRWKRVINTENSALGYALGQLYVEKYFPQQSKEQVTEIVNSIRETLKEDIKGLSWMSPSSKKAALAKLALMKERIGYPEKWRDYSGLNIDKGSYVLNILRTNQFLIEFALNKIDKPVDPDEWAMTPQTINAYYDPSMNSINLPAGILQPPFFDPKAPPAINYGSIGFVIGHEMTHGFDDQGAKFDGRGNLNNWWQKSDEEKFKAATACIASQFSNYKINGSSVQGDLVVGEATADLGGITLAYKAYHQSKAYKTAQILDGLTPDQQFFLGVAHVWAGNIRPAMARQLLATDPHPPMQYRVNGSLANMTEFQQAFSLPSNSPMVNRNRCQVW